MKMTNLIHTQPIIASTSYGPVNFYLGIDPGRWYDLPQDSEFMIIYGPTAYHSWEVVRYLVIEPRKAYAVLERRALTQEERDYFQSLLEMAVS